MSNYSPAYPSNVQVDAGVKDFITNFYGVSDKAGKNQEWLEFFHDDATLMMGLQEASGKTGVSAAALMNEWANTLLTVRGNRHPQGARGHVGEGPVPEAHRVPGLPGVIWRGQGQGRRR